MKGDRSIIGTVRTAVARDKVVSKKGEMHMEIFPSQKDSFFISQERSDGLKLKVMWDDDRVYADLRLGERFSSEADSSSSSILLGIMDVMMWCAILVATGKIGVTRKINAHFIKPVTGDEPIRASGHYINIDERDIHVMAYIKDDSGDLCATADAVFRENKVSVDQAIKRIDFTGTSSRVQMLFQSLLSESNIGLEETREGDEIYPYGPL
jgi:acyl-coenzyme A thioesterase PaaI-like protein